MCPQCGEVLTLDRFRLQDGKAKYSYCLSCCGVNERKRAQTPRFRFQRTVNAAKNRAKEKAVPFALFAFDIEALWEKQGSCCYYTREPLTMEVNNRRTILLIKLDMNASEMLEWCLKVVETFDKK